VGDLVGVLGGGAVRLVDLCNARQAETSQRKKGGKRAKNANRASLH